MSWPLPRLSTIQKYCKQYIPGTGLIDSNADFAYKALQLLPVKCWCEQESLCHSQCSSWQRFLPSLLLALPWQSLLFQLRFSLDCLALPEPQHTPPEMQTQREGKQSATRLRPSRKTLWEVQRQEWYIQMPSWALRKYLQIEKTTPWIRKLPFNGTGCALPLKQTIVNDVL